MNNDLISRSTLKKALLKRGFYPAIVKSALENAPAVDAVEVVRCGDCIYRVYKEIEDCTIGGCELIGVALPCSFYCAEGKRRADDGK